MHEQQPHQSAKTSESAKFDPAGRAARPNANFTSRRLRLPSGEVSKCARSSRVRTNPALEPGNGFQRHSPSGDNSPYTRPETDGCKGVFRRIGGFLRVLVAALLLLLTLTLPMTSFAQQVGTNLLAPPQNLTATRGDARVVLSWEAPPDNGVVSSSHYEYRYAAGASVPDTTAWTSIEVGKKTVTVGNLTNGTAYAFEVRAVYAVLGGGEPATAAATPLETLVVTVRLGSASYRFAEGASNAAVEIVAQVESGARQPDTAFNASVVSDAVAGGATVNTDYQVFSHNVNFDPADFSVVDGIWQARKTIAFTLHEDRLDESDETFEVLLRWTPFFPSWLQLREADGTTACDRRVCIATVTIENVDAVPTAPQNLAATTGDSRVALAWQAPADSGRFSVTGYEYRYAAGGSVPEATAWTSAGNRLRATAGNLTNGTAYAFEVRAVSAAGEGEPATATATPVTVPTAPQQLTVRSTAGRIYLVWSVPSSDGGSTLIRYEVRYAEGASLPQNTDWTTASLSRSFYIGNLTDGKLYTIEVRAVNDVGAGSPVRTQASPGGLPAIPQRLSAEQSDTQVELSWGAPATIGSSNLVRYEVRYAVAASVPANTAWTSVGLATTHTFTGLSNGALHTFEARAVNGQGAGPETRVQSTPADAATVENSRHLLFPMHYRTTPPSSVLTLRNGNANHIYEVRLSAGRERGGVQQASEYLVDTEFLEGNRKIRLSPRSGTTYARFVEVFGANSGIGDSMQLRGQIWIATLGRYTQGEFLLNIHYDASAAFTEATTRSGQHWSGIPRIAVYEGATEDSALRVAWSAAGGGTRNWSTTSPRIPIQCRIAGGDAPLDAIPNDGAQDSAKVRPGTATTTASSGPLSLKLLGAADFEAPNDEGGDNVYKVRLFNKHDLNQIFSEGSPSGCTGSSVDVEIEIKDAGPPAQVRNLGATFPTQSTTINVHWDAPAGFLDGSDGSVVPFDPARRALDGPAHTAVSGYDVRYRAMGASNWSELTTQDTSFEITGDANFRSYEVQVRARNGEGEGDWASDTVGGVPSAPRNFQTGKEGANIVLTWEAPSNDGGSAIERYEVRYAEGSNVPASTAWLSVGLARTHTVPSLKVGTVHSFQVRAVNARSAGPAADNQMTPTTVPTAPQDLSAAPGDTRVRLEWSAPSSDGGLEIARYEVRHAAGSSVPSQVEWTPVGLATTHTVTELANGTLHSFEVRAVNGEGGSRVSRVQATPATIPAEPQGLSALPRDTQVVLQWSAPSNNGGSAVLRYEVRHAVGASVPEGTAWTDAGLTTARTFSRLANGTVHSFEVRAVNKYGPGPAAPAQATPASVPAAPRNLATASGDTQVVLRWEAPSNNGGSAVLRYEVRHAVGASVPANTAWTPVGLVTTHTVTHLANGTLHSFEVRAVNGRGDGLEAAKQATPSDRPAAPHNFATVSGDTQVVLRWEAPSNNGGSAVLRYEVRHAAGASIPTQVAWTQVGLATTHTVTDLANGTLHSFEVRAVNGQGGGAEAKSQSTPGGLPAAPGSFSAAPGDKQVVLVWEAPSNDGGSAVLRYEVRHAAGASVPAGTAWTAVGLAKTHTVNGLANGMLYSFEVRAVNGKGEGPAAVRQATPATVPAAPRSPSATPGDSQVVLRWEAPAGIGGSDIVRYEVRHAAGTSIPAQVVWTPVGLATTHTVTDLANGTLHSFEVRAVNGKGGGPAAELQATPATVPAAPQSPSARPGDTQVVLRWEAPANIGGSNIVRYEVRHAAGTSIPAQVAWIPVGLATTHTVTELANGTLHSFEVRAVNGKGAGPAAELQETPLGNDAPVFDANTATFELEETRGTTETVARIVGLPVTASDPEGEQVTYGLEGADASAFDIDANAQILTKVGESYDYETKPRYDVTVWAQDESGARAQKEVTIVLVDIDEPLLAPQAPRVSSVVGDGTRLNVQWRASTQNGMPPIAGYNVQYREASSQQWTAHPHTGTATVTQISDLVPATRYEVRVRTRVSALGRTGVSALGRTRTEAAVSPWSAPG